MKQIHMIDALEAIKQILDNLDGHVSLGRKLGSIADKLAPEVKGYEKARGELNKKYGDPRIIIRSPQELPSFTLATQHAEGEMYTYAITEEDWEKVKDNPGITRDEQEAYMVPRAKLADYNTALDELMMTELEFTDRIPESMFDGITMPKLGKYVAMLHDIVVEG